MNSSLLVQDYESIRGSLRSLPDHELLTLVGRLSTEYVVRRDGASDAEVALRESVDAGLRIGLAVLEAQRAMLAGPISGASS